MEYAKNLKPSARGELEITDLNPHLSGRRTVKCRTSGTGIYLAGYRYTWKSGRCYQLRKNHGNSPAQKNRVSGRNRLLKRLDLKRRSSESIRTAEKKFSTVSIWWTFWTANIWMHAANTAAFPDLLLNFLNGAWHPKGQKCYEYYCYRRCRIYRKQLYFPYAEKNTRIIGSYAWTAWLMQVTCPLWLLLWTTRTSVL